MILACDTFKFKKRCQLLVRTRNETLAVAAMRVSNPDFVPVNVEGLAPAHADSVLWRRNGRQ
jgi:hypothetical protein